jgi:thioredoxin reductase (NADPH)
MTGSHRQVGIVGAGPVGLAAGIWAKRLGLEARIWDRGPLCSSVMSYPINMVFFTSNELLEIGGHPLVSGGPKATRREALDYFRKVAEREGLEVATYTEVTSLTPRAGRFEVQARDERGDSACTVDAAVVATGYYANPRRLGIPGEELPHVSHYYREAHPHWRRNVVIVGAGNSAAEAALELHRAGAGVTMLIRGERVRDTVKYWVRPDVENRIREGSIQAIFGARPQRITEREVRFSVAGEERILPADAVFLLTGFQADTTLARGAGAAVREDGTVVLDAATFETTVPGLFVIGSAGFGSRTNEVFIENGRDHARLALETIARRLGG